MGTIKLPLTPIATQLPHCARKPDGISYAASESGFT